MPFQSERQRRFLWSQYPDIAQRWSDKYGSKPVHGETLAKEKAKKKKKK